MQTSFADTRLATVFRIVAAAEALGTRTAGTGARLVGHVPHVAPEAYLHVVYPALPSSEIPPLESEVGRPLPESYRSFLETMNGLSLFSGSLSIYGRRAISVRSGDAVWQPFSVVTPNTYERPRSLAADAVVIGGYRRDGSLIYVRGSGEVIRCQREDPRPLNRWPEFPGMLAEEAVRLSAYFDELGRLRDGGRGSAPPPKPEPALAERAI